MNLKNYTTEVPVTATLGRIESFLMEIGANAIAKNIVKGRIVAVLFKLDVRDKDGSSKEHAIRLPARVDEVHEYFWRDYLKKTVKPRKVKEDFLEQAERTAWRIAEDWIKCQVSMVQLKRCEPLEIFLPFLWDGSQTYFEFLRENKFKALPAPAP